MDRNILYPDSAPTNWVSLSARRAWIEIPSLSTFNVRCLSLSARRAWIEMIEDNSLASGINVALRKESVDRNRVAKCKKTMKQRRSPQGERG